MELPVRRTRGRLQGRCVALLKVGMQMFGVTEEDGGIKGTFEKKKKINSTV